MLFRFLESTNAIVVQKVMDLYTSKMCKCSFKYVINFLRTNMSGNINIVVNVNVQ